VRVDLRLAKAVPNGFAAARDGPPPRVLNIGEVDLSTITFVYFINTFRVSIHDYSFVKMHISWDFCLQ